MTDLSPRRRQLILAICCLSLFIVGLDVTIVNVALPTIQSDYHASLSDLQWIMDAYTLVLASLLMLAGSTADRLGRRRIFRIGLVLFTLGSLACSLAPSLGFLIGARVLQALGGCMLNPVAMSIVTNTFTDAKERARAIGVWGAVFGLSMACGPVVGGVLVSAVGWRAIFWANIPVGLAAIALTTAFVPESKAPRARRPDPVGQLLVIVALASATGAIIEGPRQGWSSGLIIGAFVVAVGAVTALIAYENRRTEPLLDPRFFRSAPFSGATAIAVAAFLCLSGFLFLNALYLQDTRGYSALHTGLLTLPMAAANVILAPLSGRLVGSIGPRLPILGAASFIVVAALIMTTFTATTSLAVVMAAYVLMGCGFGLVNAPITNTAVSGMPRAQAGVAAAVASTSRQVGSSLGVAIFGSILASGGMLVHASHICWWVAVGCAVLVGMLGIITTGRAAKDSAVRTAALFTGADADSRVAVGQTS